MVNRCVIIFFLAIGMASGLRAQDAQYSQFYANPLYLNPAFTGSSGLTRAGLNYRNQWPSIEANFITYSAYIDHFFDLYNSGVGLIVHHDQEGIAGLRSTYVGGQYSYQVRLSKKVGLRAGTQLAVYNRDLNFSRLTFGEQWDPNTQSFTNPLTEPGGGYSIFFFDMAFGGLIYGENWWFGYSNYHINEPNQSLLGEDSRLPMRHSFHAGYRIPLKTGHGRPGFTRDGDERSITPTAQFRMQGQFKQLDVGMYATLEPMIVGLWYRGLPVDNPEGYFGNESLVSMIGYTFEKLSIGYSFDFTLSSLGIGAGGAHELSITYIFSTVDPRRPPAELMRIPCPKF